MSFGGLAKSVSEKYFGGFWKAKEHVLENPFRCCTKRCFRCGAMVPRFPLWCSAFPFGAPLSPLVPRFPLWSWEPVLFRGIPKWCPIWYPKVVPRFPPSRIRQGVLQKLSWGPANRGKAGHHFSDHLGHQKGKAGHQRGKRGTKGESGAPKGKAGHHHGGSGAPG